MKLKLLLAAMTMLPACLAHATLYTYTWTHGVNATFANDGRIPDGNPTGWSDTRPVNGLAPVITDVNVTLQISGGYNGDLYGYLVHDTGFAVLLNRVGKTGSNPFGYADAGFNLTLDDQATSGDIHLYGGGFVPSGSWQPDARNVNPVTVTDSSTRSAYLSAFNNLNPNGTWTLFLADLSFGDQSTLVSWGLQIEAVPEPVNVALAVFGGLAGAVAGIRWWTRRRARRAGA